MVLEFLDTDIFNPSTEHCVSFLDPLVESWDIDLATFDLGIVSIWIDDVSLMQLGKSGEPRGPKWR